MRRRRFGLIWVLIVMLLALMLPATTAARSAYTYFVVRNNCRLEGGAYGHGFVRLKVAQEEWNRSGTNYFRIRTRLQFKESRTSAWYTQDTATDISESFPNDSTDSYWFVGVRYDFTRYEARNYYHRLVMRLQWWDQRAGPDVLLSEKWVTSKAC